MFPPTWRASPFFEFLECVGDGDFPPREAVEQIGPRLAPRVRAVPLFDLDKGELTPDLVQPGVDFDWTCYGKGRPGTSLAAIFCVMPARILAPSSGEKPRPVDLRSGWARISPLEE